MLLIMTSLWYLLGYTFKFIEAVSGTVLDMINALDFYRGYFLAEGGCFSHHQVVNEAVNKAEL